ncbi:hypothetical protein KAI12_03515 [Candidatus Bathyarchaeota archaeon]|nr:hypothetical protein [Candidatus Bathyarchaeota archaeon]
MAAKATVHLTFASQKYPALLVRALVPEINSSTSKRFEVKLQSKANSLSLLAEATDVVALRASINAYLRWIESLKNVLELMDKLC